MDTVSWLLVFIVAFVVGFIPSFLVWWWEYRRGRRDYQEETEFWGGVYSGRAEVIRMALDTPPGPVRDGLLAGVAESIRIEREVKGDE